MPAISGTVNVSVADTAWMAVGQVLYIETAGYFEVNTIVSALTVTLENLGYTGNAAPTTVISTGKKVSPGGISATENYLKQGTNTLTELTKILTNTFEFYIKSGVNDAALPASYMLVDPDQARLQFVIDADKVFEVVANETGAGLHYSDASTPSDDVSFGVVPGKAVCTKDIEITDINSGIIMTSPGGFRFRYTPDDSGNLIPTPL